MSDQPFYSEGVCGDGAAILRDGVPMRIHEIVAALNRLSKWQPIETAPQGDRESALVYEADDEWITIGTWCARSKEWQQDDGRVIYPTHWMPLPKPPPAPARD